MIVFVWPHARGHTHFGAGKKQSNLFLCMNCTSFTPLHCKMGRIFRARIIISAQIYCSQMASYKSTGCQASQLSFTIVPPYVELVKQQAVEREHSELLVCKVVLYNAHGYVA